VSALRQEVRAHLERGEYAPVLGLAAARSGVARALVSLLYDPDELVRWRAVSALGHLAGAHPEQAQPLVARLLLSLNDESGGIGWMSAPALGDIGRNAPALLRGCIRVVVHFFEEPFVLPGVLWAVGRLAPAFPAETREVVPEIAARCGADEPGVRAHAAFALGAVGDPRARAALAAITGDERPARVYVGDRLVTRQVREWAGEALSGLRAA
jgi:HEAT repeat protein